MKYLLLAFFALILIFAAAMMNSRDQQLKKEAAMVGVGWLPSPDYVERPTPLIPGGTVLATAINPDGEEYLLSFEGFDEDGNVCLKQDTVEGARTLKFSPENGIVVHDPADITKGGELVINTVTPRPGRLLFTFERREHERKEKK